MLTTLGRWWDRLLGAMALLAAVAMVLTLVSTFGGVVTRYVFGRPRAWTVELSEYALLYMVFLGAAWLLREDGHVRMDLLLQQFGVAKRAVLEVGIYLACAVLVGLIAYYGIVVTWEAYAAGALHEVSSLRPPRYLLLLPIPVGGVCLFVECLRRSAVQARLFRDARRRPVETEDVLERATEKEAGLF